MPKDMTMHELLSWVVCRTSRSSDPAPEPEEALLLSESLLPEEERKPPEEIGEIAAATVDPTKSSLLELPYRREQIEETLWDLALEISEIKLTERKPLLKRVEPRMPDEGSDAVKGEGWRLPPGVTLTTCIQAVQQENTTPTLLVCGLEADLEGSLRCPFDEIERETLIRALTIAMAARRHLACHLFLWAFQFGNGLKSGSFNEQSLQEIVGLICGAANWQLDEGIVTAVVSTPNCCSAPGGDVTEGINSGMQSKEEEMGECWCRTRSGSQ